MGSQSREMNPSAKKPFFMLVSDAGSDAVT
jgi:hypothetical protein